MIHMNILASDIVVGIDGSDSSLTALRWAKRLAEGMNLGVHVLIAWHYPAMVAPSMLLEDPAEQASNIAQDAVTKVFGRGDAVPIDVVLGPPAGLLVEASRSAAMLVVGSRGHGGFAGLLLGSVSSACAEHAECPVLVVHDHRCP